ncbi:MAG: molybdopterin converting factor subunit 1 [Gammaproteobacteria bacterium]|nr:molybdopterin converting factor subunit 1 [Gammaproteobacteria bacterium]MDP2141202.1 molybdopterin converting factor subunit 1 [Gammaproteobacteria bacterium]MDP2349124.1 molybdopterin converting factor subunit 1 [Gammaproteobacteria bacterium]
MLTINYFASLREELGSGGETLTLPEQVTDVARLIDHLVQTKGESWSALKDSSRVLIAVDQVIVDRGHRLHGTEEVAFFPPMTGG